MNKFFLTAVIFMNSVIAFSQTRVEAEAYTDMSGVATENAWGDGTGTNVGWIDNGDWMKYTIHPTTTGVYTFIFRIATPNSGAQFKIKKLDGTVLATVDVPNTTGYQSWQSKVVTLNLPAGDQTIIIESSAADIWNFNWFEYSYGYKLEAEFYSNMLGVDTEPTMDEGGGQDVGWIDNGDWIDYSVNLAAAGTYTAMFRLACPNTNAQLQVKKSDGTILSIVNIPVTANYQTWQTAEVNVTLPAGQQTLRLQSTATNGGYNINWWALVPAGVSNVNPVANAGSDAAITLPSNSISLNGSGSDADGAITTYAWSKLSGPNTPSFGSASSATTAVNGLIQGVYVFRLTVTDDQSATGYDDITVTVNAASSGSSTWSTGGNGGIDPASQFIGTTDAQPLVFKTNGQKQAMLTSDGVFMAKKIRVTQSGWADYVFDSTYRLKPLSEVEKFINTNKHLPEVPSANQVTNEGINIGDNQAVLLKKIEELTLYIIEQDKKIKQLQSQNSELQEIKKQLDQIRSSLRNLK